MKTFDHDGMIKLFRDETGEELNSFPVTFARFCWNKCSELYEHALKNKEQASQMKIAILERQLSDAKKEFDACHVTKNILRDTHEKLEQRLKDAEEVIAFYAEGELKGDLEIKPEKKDLWALPDKWSQRSMSDHYGGKRARDYQEKYSEDK